jgi:hypothetical protein
MSSAAQPEPVREHLGGAVGSVLDCPGTGEDVAREMVGFDNHRNRKRSKVDGRAEEDAKNARINETRVELVVGIGGVTQRTEPAMRDG